jgi:Tubulin-tyrosine ligase family
VGSDDNDREHDKKYKMTSQFCWNGMIVSKEHLARTMKKAYGTVPFLPVTYDLSHADQLKNFIDDFNRRASVIKLNQKKKIERSKICDKRNDKIKENAIEEKEEEKENGNEDENEDVDVEDNIWIMKRYRGRQSMDYPITDSLSCALRHLETAPRLACKYVTHPSLFKGRKYDLRFYVIVLSLDPFVAYRHVMFVIRAANVQYSSNDLEQYQKHFTVMNFIDDNSNSEDDSVRVIRGSGERENPTSIQFIENFNLQHAVKNKNKNNVKHNKNENKNKKNCDRKVDKVIDTKSEEAKVELEVEVQVKAAAEEEAVAVEDVWGTSVQPSIDSMLRHIFEGVLLAFPHEPSHPSGQVLHPNSGEKYNTYKILQLHVRTYICNFLYSFLIFHQSYLSTTSHCRSS